MTKLDTNSTLKRLRNHYRLVIMNEDTYEEVAKFKLSRLSVYIIVSSIFVLFTVLIVSLIVFTPIKYYIPGTGYGDIKQMREYKQLKIRTDSVEASIKLQQQHLDNIKKVLEGKVPKLDTNKLELPKEETVSD